MDLHGNAALSWSGRRELARRVVDEGWTLTAAAEAAGVSVRCARKWVGRYRAGDRRLRRSLIGAAAGRESHAAGPGRGDRAAAPVADDRGRDRRDAGDAALDRLGGAQAHRDRPARPDRARARRSATSARGRASSSTSTSRSSAASRRRRQARRRPRTQAATAAPHATRTATTAASTGWEFVHVAVDDYSRLAYAEVLADEKAIDRDRLPPTRARLLRPPRHHSRADPHRQRLRLPSHRARRSPAAQLGIRHLRTRPRRPQTNGKAERFIRTLLNGWAYGAIYRSSNERTSSP